MLPYLETWQRRFHCKFSAEDLAKLAGEEGCRKTSVVLPWHLGFLSLKTSSLSSRGGYYYHYHRSFSFVSRIVVFFYRCVFNHVLTE